MQNAEHRRSLREGPDVYDVSVAGPLEIRKLSGYIGHAPWTPEQSILLPASIR